MAGTPAAVSQCPETPGMRRDIDPQNTGPRGKVAQVAAT